MALSILRIGASNDSFGTQLADALVQHLKPVTASEKENNSSNNNNNKKNTSTLLAISNRYFDATVSLTPLALLMEGSTTASTAAAASTATSAAPDGDEGRREDGILMVFDDASKTSFDVLDGLHGRAEATNQNGDLLRLCIGIVTNMDTNNTVRDTKEYEAEYSRRVLWCLDHGYEFVEAVDLSPEGTTKGHDAREKDGFARVIEAIQGTVWSSAVMHNRKKQQLKQSYQETREEQQQQQHVSATKSTYEPPLLSTLSDIKLSDDEETKQREEQARAALLKEDGIILKDDDDVAKIVDENDNTSVSGKDESLVRNGTGEKLISDMEAAIKEATRIRSMSQAGELSDKERRQRAGDAAMVLMNLMNQLDEDEGSSSENEEGAIEEKV